MKLIEAMARAMCAEDGFDPEVYVSMIKMPPLYGARGHLVATTDSTVIPQWTPYRPLALAALSVINKANISEE